MKNNQTIIVVRHGECYLDSLTKKGKNQICQLAKSLQPFIEPRKAIKIFTSPSNRTIMSAKIIAKHFNVENIVEIDNIGEDDLNQDKPLEFLKSKDAEEDIVILITHKHHVESIPKRFASKLWGKQKHIRDIKHGEAVVIGCLYEEIIHVETNRLTY